MDWVMDNIKGIFMAFAGMVAIALLQYAITWPFVFFKYVFDRERPFWETWHDYAESLEKFTRIVVKILFAVFIVLLFYASFV